VLFWSKLSNDTKSFVKIVGKMAFPSQVIAISYEKSVVLVFLKSLQKVKLPTLLF